MEDVVEDDQQKALVGQEDDPLPAQSVQVDGDVSRGDGQHQHRDQHLVGQEPHRANAWQTSQIYIKKKSSKIHKF